MTKLEAIDERRSRRLYLAEPIDALVKAELQKQIDVYNAQSGLAIRFIEDASAAFRSFRKTYGLFSGVRSMLAMVGPKNDPNLREKIGYFGEMLVLDATILGLGSCWVGGTFDSNSNLFQKSDEESMICVIPIGQVETLSFKEKMVHQMVAGKSKTIEQVLKTDAKIPELILDGLKAALKAPSAANRQPVRFVYYKDELSAYTDDDGKFNLVDLGIVKAHFDVATGGRFALGNPGKCVL